MTQRIATCSCGQLRARCEGEPVRVSMCHCLECQKRTGSTFEAQARWPRDMVTIEGRTSEYVRIADSGKRLTFYFCPRCGATVYYQLEDLPDLVAVAMGSFADPTFPEPKFSVYESRKHAWSGIPADAQHFN
jgi:hypothetical protein